MLNSAPNMLHIAIKPANLNRELPRIPFLARKSTLNESVILSEAAAKKSAAESKDLAVLARSTQGPSTRADALARDDNVRWKNSGTPPPSSTTS